MAWATSVVDPVTPAILKDTPGIWYWDFDGQVTAIQLSLDGTTWVDGTVGLSVLGGTLLAYIWDPADERTVSSMALTPTVAGTSTYYLRGVVPSGYTTVVTSTVTCYVGSVPAPPAGITVWSGTAWVAPNVVGAGGGGGGVTVATSLNADPYVLAFRVPAGASSQLRIGATIYTPPATKGSTSTFWWAIVVFNSELSVVRIAWVYQSSSSAVISLSAMSQDGSCLVMLTGTTALTSGTTEVYGWNGSLVRTISHTTPATHKVMYLDSTGWSSWMQAFTANLQSLPPSFAVRSNYAVMAFGLTTTSTGTMSGTGWSYTKSSSGPAIVFIRMNLATGAVEWTRALTRPSNSLLNATWVLTEDGNIYCICSSGGSGGVVNTLGSLTLAVTTPNLAFGIGPDGTPLWLVLGITGASTGGYGVTTWGGSTLLFQASVSTTTSPVTATFGGQSVVIPAGSTNVTVVAKVNPVNGTASWLQTFPSIVRAVVDDRYYYREETTSYGPSIMKADANNAFSEIRLGSYTSFSRRAIRYDGVIWGNTTVAAGAPVTLTDADLDTTTLSSVGVFVLSLSAYGDWNFTGGSTLPPATGTQPPIPPVCAAWPATAAEDDNISGTFTGADPENPTPVAYQLQVRNPATGVWSGATEEGGFAIGNKGKVSITQSGLAGSTLNFDPEPGWYGTLNLFLRWRAVDDDGIRDSATAKFTTVYINTPEATTTPDGPDLECSEDGSDTRTWSFETDPDFTGTYTWQFSPQTEAPYTTMSNTITVLDGGDTAGSVTVSDQDDAEKTADITFTASGDWNGSASFSVRVSNGNVWSDWRVANVTVNPVADAPSAVIGDAPNVSEDDTTTFTLTWTDPDDLEGDFTAGSQFTLELAAEDGPWKELLPGGPDDFINTPGVVIRLLSYSGSALAATLRVEPEANYEGDYAFRVRVADHSDTDTVRGPARTLSATVVPVPDAPARITPTTMPLAKWGQAVTQTFTTFDPDAADLTWEFALSASGTGGWGDTLTITNVGTLTVIDTDLGDQTATVRLDQVEGGATVREYAFWMRVKDNTDLTSTPVRVTGYISDPIAGVWLQRVDRTASTGADVVRLCPLTTVSGLSLTEAIEGAGGCDFTVTAAELLRRANQLGVGNRYLLDPGRIEVVISAGGERLWVGPITDVAVDATGDLVSISALGLWSYLEARHLDADTDFINTDISAIVWGLVDETQGQTYGDLALTDGTVLAGTNATVEFPRDTSIAAAIDTVRELVGAPEVWIDAERQVRSAPWRGIDNRSRVRLTSGVARVASWQATDETLVTVATVVGADNGSGGYYRGTATNTTAMATYGRFEQVITNPQLLSDAACAAVAAKVVNRKRQRIEKLNVELTLTSTRPRLGDLAPGNLITVDLLDAQLGRILGDFRIVTRDVRLDATPDGYQVSLGLEPAIFVDGVLIGSRSRHNPQMFAKLSQLDARR